MYLNSPDEWLSSLSFESTLFVNYNAMHRKNILGVTIKLWRSLRSHSGILVSFEWHHSCLSHGSPLQKVRKEASFNWIYSGCNKKNLLRKVLVQKLMFFFWSHYSSLIKFMGVRPLLFFALSFLLTVNEIWIKLGLVFLKCSLIKIKKRVYLKNKVILMDVTFASASLHKGMLVV